MKAGLTLLALAYVLSQFFRAFLAVLTAPLGADLGIGPDVLATASGLWFLAFAAMQIPVGIALDSLGPRRTAGWLFLFGGAGGAALFAVAQGPLFIHAAMIMIGVGCSPVLMASFYIFAREFEPARFATLAALMIGVGTVGNLISSYPLAFTADTIGWRAALSGLAALSGVIAFGILTTVRDPAKVTGPAEGRLMDLLRLPVLWLIIPLAAMNYVPAGAVRGLWIGPYLRDVFEMSTSQIGQASLVMSVAMIAGVVAYGPLDRMLGTRKWVVFAGNVLTAVCVLALAVWVDVSPILAIALMAGIGFFGATFPVIVAHGRSFFPAHLTGRGVTLMNLFGIGGVGVMQFASGRVHSAAAGSDPSAPYVAVFALIGVALVLGLIPYARSRDNVG
ncbi:MFS transporter [uncultured Tateyamaria sp.]|uniref:MFS transporter n=1 Tax=uncultured Tateyamaria sp. TaxID=455651 RepID=UPI00260E26AB|nr:MFS transporter [uncultured Tateyamaria sp.]